MSREVKRIACVLCALLILIGSAAISRGQNAADSKHHKIQVYDPALAARIAAAGGRLIADYGGYKVYDAPWTAADLPDGKAELRDDYNSIFLNTTNLDTSKPEVQSMRKKAGAFSGKRMHLVHFAGPVQPDWRKELLETGVEIVSYIPQNAYLVRGDCESIARVQALAAVVPRIQWEGPYLDNYKIQPAARLANAGDHFAIQLAQDAVANPESIKLIDQLELGPVEQLHTVLRYIDIVTHVSPANLAQIAARPDVVSIQRYGTPKKVCERQDQIVAGNLSGNIPSGPGYLAWLQSKGFSQAQFDTSAFVVDMSDSGIDNGATSPNHFGLYAGGQTANASRVMYNRLEGTANPGSTLKGCDGHGTLNAHIVCGYDNSAGFPFADSEGYHYGLGVCPFVRVGSSVIFDPYDFTSPFYSDLTSRAYSDGARISNNSWGDDNSDGSYGLDAQEYDSLVRDAQPDGSADAAPGNQEMTFVFAAGNDGNAPDTISPPGTAKNVITAGGAENVQKFGGADDGADLGGNTDAQADNANAMLEFSGRGPCNDGRQKPDLVAPAVHVSGGVIQAAGPKPDGTADSCFVDQSSKVIAVDGGSNGSYFFPAGQQFYTASSGTSHSTPCVSGGCALVRQYFINNGWAAPSPAMIKAYLMNSARYMTGAGANDTLWSSSQGMGEMNLGMAFDGAPRILSDEASGDLFTASGQSRVFTGVVANSARPFRVTIAWTDAPGSTTGAAYNNDLDLTVTVGGNIYKGNVFSGPYSTTGGAADPANNVESVFLPAGVSGAFTVTVNATSINSTGVPNPAGDVNQDFALVIYNAGAIPLTVAPPAITFPPDGFSTNRASVKISGTGIPDATATLYDGTNSAGTATVNGSGVFSLTVTLSNGPHSLTAAETSGGFVSAPSPAIMVTLNLAPAILVEPRNQTGFLNGAVTFTSAASGAVPMRFYWEKNGVKIPGAVNSNLTLVNLAAGSAASYQMIVTNAYGSAISAAAVLRLAPNPFSNLAGMYYGLFSEIPPRFESSGSLTLTLGALGHFSARILNVGDSYGFSGVFPINGEASATVSRGAGAVPLIVALNLDVPKGTEQITGTVSNSAWAAALQADRATYGNTNPFPNQGRYTMLLGGVGGVGDGYGTFSITSAGLVSFSGVLPDNTSIAPSAVSISKYGQWPLYVALDGKVGALVGWLDFTNGDFVGDASWFRIGANGALAKSGFTNSLSVTSSTFVPASSTVPVLDMTNLSVNLSGGGLPDTLSNNVILSSGGKLFPSGSEISNLVLSVSPASGAVSGSFIDPVTRRATAIRGVVLQQQSSAGGFFVTSNATGTFVLTPQP